MRTSQSTAAHRTLIAKIGFGVKIWGNIIIPELQTRSIPSSHRQAVKMVSSPCEAVVMLHFPAIQCSKKFRRSISESSMAKC